MTSPFAGLSRPQFCAGPDIPEMSIGKLAVDYIHIDQTAKISSKPRIAPEKYAILERHKSEYAEKITEHSVVLLNKFASIVAGYVATVPIMDRDGWKKYYGVDIGEESENVKDALSFDRFYKFYHGPSPEDLMNGVSPDQASQVCQVSLIPVVMPEKFTYLDDSKSCYLTHQTLRELAEHPTQGHAARYTLVEPLLEHVKERTKRMSLIVLFNDVVAKYSIFSEDAGYTDEESLPEDAGCTNEESWSDQVQYLKDLNAKTDYGCETEPNALSRNTALIAHHAVTGQTSISNDPKSHARTRERVRVMLENNEAIHHLISQNDFTQTSTLPAADELIVSDDRMGPGMMEALGLNVGIPLMKKF